MRITYSCLRCEATNRVEVSSGDDHVTCEKCGLVVRFPIAAWDSSGVHRCLVCPCEELYIRKDFPQRLGVAIVSIGFAVSCIPWYYGRPLWTYAVLFATAFVDLALYLSVKNALICYRCACTYQAAPGLESHDAFDLETHERYRQERIRLEQAAQEAALSARSTNSADSK